MDRRLATPSALLFAAALSLPAPATAADRAQVIGQATTAMGSGGPIVADSGAAGGNATTGVGGGTFDLNAFLGASRYYDAGVNGQNTVAFNLEAGHFWNGHETLSHVASSTANFVNASSTFGSGSLAPLYDRHATAVAMLIGGRPTAVNPDVRQQGLAPGTSLRSAAIATGWVGSAYALSFNISGSTYVDAFARSFGTAQVVNSSFGYSDPAGTDVVTIFSDGMAWANPGTLHVVSAGNSGPSANTVGAPGSGYNTLTVGALGSANAFNSASGFSSRGPQDFGYVNASAAVVTVAAARAAVDLAAPGESIRSAFYGGQTGGNDVSLAGSTDLGSNAAAYADVNGTSFAAPIVAGGATLVASAARSLAPLAANPDAAQSVVVKSLLMTGADKTAGWSNGLTSVTVGGTTYLTTTQALDQAVGAGRMNLDATFGAQVTGQTDVLGTGTGVIGSVLGTGWDYGTAVRTVSNDYLLPTLSGSTAFTATLSWLRNRDAITDVLDVAQADLNLSLWQLDGSGAFTTLIARSESLYVTSEHLFLSLPAEARYGLRVEYPFNTFDNTVGGVWGTAANPQPYGLSWMGTVVPIPEPATWVLALAGVGATLVVRRRRRVAGARGGAGQS